jgi:hypothetical protein
MVALVLVFCALLYVRFGWLSVPRGMDTMPHDAPSGTLCLVAKQPSVIAVGAIVFVAVPGGGTVVSRVVGFDGNLVLLEHDNKQSRVGFGDRRGSVPREAVRGLVLCAFAAESS